VKFLVHKDNLIDPTNVKVVSGELETSFPSMSAPKKAGSSRSNPGANLYGNFIDYYRFHPVKERMRQIPDDVYLSARPSNKYVALDIGCNAGVKSLSYFDIFKSSE
jgi:hypothetical protein